MKKVISGVREVQLYSKEL